MSLVTRARDFLRIYLTAESRIEERFKKVIGCGRGVRGTCFRSVKPYFANQNDVLSPEGSRISGGRYNELGEGVIYLAYDPHTCLEETTRSCRDDAFSVAQKKLPRTIVGIQVELSNVLYLTSYKICIAIGITKSVLTKTDW